MIIIESKRKKPATILKKTIVCHRDRGTQKGLRCALNLSVSSYVEQEDTREVINITEVNAKLETLVAEGNELNQKIEAIIKELGE